MSNKGITLIGSHSNQLHEHDNENIHPNSLSSAQQGPSTSSTVKTKRNQHQTCNNNTSTIAKLSNFSHIFRQEKEISQVEVIEQTCENIQLSQLKSEPETEFTENNQIEIPGENQQITLTELSSTCSSSTSSSMKSKKINSGLRKLKKTAPDFVNKVYHALSVRNALSNGSTSKYSTSDSAQLGVGDEYDLISYDGSLDRHSYDNNNQSVAESELNSNLYSPYPDDTNIPHVTVLINATTTTTNTTTTATTYSNDYNFTGTDSSTITSVVSTSSLATESQNNNYKKKSSLLVYLTTSVLSFIATTFVLAQISRSQPNTTNETFHTQQQQNHNLHLKSSYVQNISSLPYCVGAIYLLSSMPYKQCQVENEGQRYPETTLRRMTWKQHMQQSKTNTNYSVHIIIGNTRENANIDIIDQNDQETLFDNQLDEITKSIDESNVHTNTYDKFYEITSYYNYNPNHRILPFSNIAISILSYSKIDKDDTMSSTLSSIDKNQSKTIFTLNALSCPNYPDSVLPFIKKSNIQNFDRSSLCTEMKTMQRLSLTLFDSKVKMTVSIFK